MNAFARFPRFESRSDLLFRFSGFFRFGSVLLVNNDSMLDTLRPNLTLIDA